MISEQELLSKHIRPRHSVVAIGAFAHMQEDPSVAHAGTIARKVTIVDAQAPDKTLDSRQIPSDVRERIREMSAEAHGKGDPILHRQSIQEFKSEHKLADRNVRLITPKIRFASALDTGLRKGSADVVIDRGTSSYVIAVDSETAVWGLNRAGEEQKAAMRERIQRLTGEYERILKRNGTAILMFVDRHQDMLQEIKKSFTERGFSVEEHRLATTPYRIAGENVSKDRPSHLYGYALVAIKKG